MSTTLYADSIEELIDLKIEQKVLGEHKGASIKLQIKRGRPRKYD